jgi:hypothetical protein
MGRTRRRGPRPPLACTDIQYDTLDRFHKLKRHKDEPLYSVYNRACTALEAYTDMEETVQTIRENIPKLQKRLTEKSTDLCNIIEVLPKEVLETLLNNENRSRFSEDMIIQVRKVLGQTVLI